MAWIILNSGDSSDFVGFIGSSFRWHVKEGELYRIPDRREASIHGNMLIEGRVQLDGSGRLRIEK